VEEWELCEDCHDCRVASPVVLRLPGPYPVRAMSPLRPSSDHNANKTGPPKRTRDRIRTDMRRLPLLLLLSLCACNFGATTRYYVASTHALPEGMVIQASDIVMAKARVSIFHKNHDLATDPSQVIGHRVLKSQPWAGLISLSCLSSPTSRAD
jgi:hypothetical protein